MNWFLREVGDLLSGLQMTVFPTFTFPFNRHPAYFCWFLCGVPSGSVATKGGPFLHGKVKLWLRNPEFIPNWLALVRGHWKPEKTCGMGPSDRFFFEPDPTEAKKFEPGPPLPELGVWEGRLGSGQQPVLPLFWGQSTQVL